MRHCLTLDLRDDPDAIAAYDRHHAALWPEVLAGLKASGIDDMTIWRRGTRLMMLIETATDFDLAKLVVSHDSHPRVKEWEKLMATLQKPLPDADASGLWQPMNEIFSLRHAQDQE